MADPHAGQHTAPRFLSDPIERVMRSYWAQTSPHASLLEAERLMRLARIRQLPVLVDDLLVGVLGHGDLIRALISRLLATVGGAGRHGLLGGVPVGAVMDPNPATAAPDETVGVVALRMLQGNVACLPVVIASNGSPARMVGLVVESDLLRLAYGGPGRSS